MVDANDNMPDGRTPLPEWQPHLDCIFDAIDTRINPPVAMASGNRGELDKACAETYKSHLQNDPGIPLVHHWRTYKNNTGDMGVEMGVPGVRVDRKKGHESLLPRWVQRAADDADMMAVDADSKTVAPPARQGRRRRRAGHRW